MTVREFLRGGYHEGEGDGVTLVLNAGEIEGVWIRGGDLVRVLIPGADDR